MDKVEIENIIKSTNSQSKKNVQMIAYEKSLGPNSSISKFQLKLRSGSQHSLINQSVQSISVFQWVLFLTVIAIIFASTAQLIYSSLEVMTASSINTISGLGDVLYSISNLAAASRLSDWSIRINSPNILGNLKQVNTSLKVLEDVEKNLFENSDD